MKIPVALQLALIAVGMTGFYTWVGQMVPQKEVHPPEVVEIKKDVTAAEMVEIGKEIFNGKGICATCHTKARFPNLDTIGTTAATRIPGLNGVQYLAQSLYEPDTFIVPGFIPGMPAVNKPPIGLTDDEIKTVIAYLQSLGGEVTVTMETDLFATNGAGAAPAEEGAAEVTEGAAPAAAATVFASKGCGDCHHLDQPGELNGGPSLQAIGSRLDRRQLLIAITEHKVTDQGPTGLDSLTLAEVQSMVDDLSALQ